MVMKKILFFVLKVFAKLVLKKYKPKIVGITGSVGKTTTKGVTEALLEEKFHIRASQASFNNQIGLPLTILGLGTSNSYGVWSKNFFKSLKLLLIKDVNYPEILVLEMGADRIGDIQYLNSIAPADVAVLTEVSAAHVEWFGSVEKIFEEKTDIFEGKKDQICIINLDSEYIAKRFESLKYDLQGKTLVTYGFKSDSTVRASNFVLKGAKGVSFELKYVGEEVKIEMKRLFSKHSIYSVLAATSVALSLGMKLVEIAKRLEDISLEKGRMNLLQGINDSLVLDDSYNSSPLACKQALKTLSDFGTSGRKIAVLGDMLELGELSKQEHKDMGKYISKLGNIDLLITCGEQARYIGEGFDGEKGFHFENSENAKPFVVEKIKQGDVILTKGSQGSRMEKVIKEIMLEKDRAKELLVRQTGVWAKNND